MENDTICAISTPLGVSGIGIVRLSGKDTYRIIEEIFAPGKNPKKKKKFKISELPSHTVHYGHIVENGKIIDEVIVTIMKSPKSYTKEDMAEINCHGGIVPLREVLNLCIKKGARLAEPGEFTKRAFLNGRIDLTQAESILDIIYSKTNYGLNIGIKKLKGFLSKFISEIKEKIFNLLVEVEAKINFPEEEDVEKYPLDFRKELKNIYREIERFLEKSNKGKIIQTGVNVAIIGSPNVGKSSLLNAFLKEDRAIVTEIPGTTRDAIIEIVNIKGIPFNIIDTAGIRKAKNKIEKIGVEKSIEWMEKAEINLLIIDGSRKLNEYDYQLLNHIKEKPYLIIINKIDLPQKVEIEKIYNEFQSDRIIKASIKNYIGIEEIENKLLQLVSEGFGEIKGDEIYLNLRQEKKINTIKQYLKEILNENSIEIVAENLKRCINEIDELTGNKINDKILDQIFSNFCIGK
ncbi:MAG: tRNA uridine-5-carboxymethylaminomethyl(34) synthesis GTPase MnmE [Candidatus Omnitrophica bacterium]|nr:tRNA uridine-5-carboxymethylaminomethyl(34) synthesis GTPase MnmE [Candidatus Omnitrophota bacterium]MCM8803506.1 tRNA uridine-5-carboxymethylaminomethyl(34) synthesis GTPase MnmE [Candidatus Omnitrophota bacterium]